MSSFVGIDASLTGTGVCVKIDDTTQVHTIKTNPRTKPNDLERLRYISDEIMALVPEDVSLICIEDYFTPTNKFQMGSAISLVGLGITIRLAMYEKGIPFVIVSPSQLKKFVSGKGNIAKNMVIHEIYKRYGKEVKDDNQADSLVLAYLADAIWSLHIDLDLSDLPKFQIDLAKKVYKERPKYHI